MKKHSIPVTTLNSTNTVTKNVIDITLRSCNNAFEQTLTFLTIPEIINSSPSETFPRELFDIPKNIHLADPQFHVPQSIDMLIGSEPSLSLLSVGQIKRTHKNYNLCLQKTLLGWIVAGSVSSSKSLKPQRTVNCNLVDLDTQISKFWALEEVNVGTPQTSQEIQCENHFRKHFSRNHDGRYVVRLPFIDGDRQLGDSRSMAYRRLYALERKFASNPELKIEYSKIMQEYIDLGHMSPSSDDASGYYLPHHAVIKLSSSTTKVRVVFDASAKTDKGKSLNDLLLVGPTIQDTIFAQLLKFRSHKYVITADIEKMYRQILLHENDRAFQKILWRVNGTICTFHLNTVTFGVSSSPFLAIRTIHQLAEDENTRFPRASKVIQNDLYVDDLLTGADTIEDTRQLRNEIIDLLKCGQFNIRQWASNDPRLIADLADANINAHCLLDKNRTLKTLGIYWDAEKDLLRYTIDPIKLPSNITKRNILSEIAKIFDPLGLVGPVVLYAKKIMQDIWLAKLQWDESVPHNIHTTWCNFIEELNELNSVTFDRFTLSPNCSDIQVHGFCDASNTGYGACLYLRSSSSSQDNIHCRLLCAKSRVAPLKPVTIPRLELCGAQVLTHLYEEAAKTFQFTPSKIIFWTDSTIVLQWLKTSPSLLNQYVANRVADVQERSSGCEWRHVRSEDNPADALSRGQLPKALINNLQWSQGPAWLHQTEMHWPKPFDIVDKTNLEFKKNVCLAAAPSQSHIDTLLKSRLSYSKILRINAYIMRFLKANKYRGSSTFSADEINDSETKLIQILQASHFESELREIKTNGQVKKSRYANLCPFVDDQGLLRVGGRLKRADLMYGQKHPILLPSKNPLTDLIITDIHTKRYHTGIQTTLSAIRQRFWILDGKNQVRQVIRKCITCFHFTAEAKSYKMGDLPHDRVNEAMPFKNVGIDYCGPFFIKEKKFRNRNSIKTYVCVFVCMAVKAVHLEVVSDMTTEGFLGALRRFTARRGTPHKIYSDNGSNFIGANNQLKELYQLLNSAEHRDQVNKFAIENTPRITWNFIPPLSPHQGGLWESTVKLFKHHLRRVVGNELFTYEQFTTLTIEIEGILNSRPLTPLSSDPNDLHVLTPSHILTGEPLRNLPEDDLRFTADNRLSTWQHITKVRQDFWSRWRLEYLHELQKRNKWVNGEDNIRVGTIVLIKDKNIPCLRWPLGRIIAVHPGDDQVVRTVTIQTSKGVLKRSVTLLCPLPFKDNNKLTNA